MESMPKAQRPETVKIIFVGQHGAGKTSLIQREGSGTFNTNHLATIGVDFRMKTYRLKGGQVRAQFWDSAGQERFRSLQQPYYRRANAICVCFDLSNPDSLTYLEKALNDAKAYKEPNASIYVIGCKMDLPSKVSIDAGFQLWLTSAKESRGIEQAFKVIVEEAYVSNILRNLPAPTEVRTQLESTNRIVKKPCCG